MGTVKSEPAYLPYLVFRSCVRLRLGPKSDSKASSNRQDKWAWIRGRFQPGHIYWTLLKHIEPHDPVFFAEARRRMAVEPTTTGIHSGLHHRATKPCWTFWSANSPQPFPILRVRVSFGLGCSKDSLDPKLGLGHGLSRLCWSLGDAAEPPRYPVWIRLRLVAYGTYSV